MNITITIPDEITDLLTGYMGTCFTEEGSPKYSDLQDMCQQQIEVTFFQRFADQVLSSAMAELQAQLAVAQQASAVVMPSQANKLVGKGIGVKVISQDIQAT